MDPEANIRGSDRDPGGVRVVIVGLGNILQGDDGVGVLAVEGLPAPAGLPERVRVLSGGTVGVDLLAWLEPDERVVLLDAVRAGERPGTLHRIDLEDIEDPDRPALSVHDLGVRHLLQQARLLGRPLYGVLLGVEPEVLEPALRRLSPAVAAVLPALRSAALQEAGRLAGPI